MSDEFNRQHMAISDLARWCAHETELYFQHQSHDPSYCFEMFRRAIRERDQAAWQIICVNYEPLVAGWVRRHPGFETSGEEVQYFVNGAFGKIANTLTSERFGGFSDTSSLLRYLKMCVHSVIVDYNRLIEQAKLQVLDEALEEVLADSVQEEETISGPDQKAFWNWINARLHDEKERSVIYGCFVLAMKPQEVYEHFPNRFHDVDEIYRIKQNVIARLRRDLEFRKFIGGDD